LSSSAHSAIRRDGHRPLPGHWHDGLLAEQGDFGEHAVEVGAEHSGEVAADQPRRPAVGAGLLGTAGQLRAGERVRRLRAMVFKLAPSFKDSDAQAAGSVRFCAAPRCPMLPTFCPTNDQGPDRRAGDQALDLLLPW
jgi:hypothetical protein